MLLERDRFLAELDHAHASALASQGAIALVSGEAGIGKTALVESFCTRVTQADPRTRVLWGACDALFTPRPLGPLLDMARQTQGLLRELARSGADRERLFAALLDELSRPASPSIAVFEDVHWADEATLDLLKFLARRVARTSGLLILTFRDDEVAPGHPLHRLLGELSAATVRRLALPPLTTDAVRTLAGGAARAARELHAATGGNPFYVMEVLATDGNRIPASVRDAVLARALRVSAAARAALDVVAVVPGRAERWLLARVLGADAALVDEGVSAGLLRATRDAVAFRHELARRAWEDSLTPAHACALHARVLAALQVDADGSGMQSRMVHHAALAGDGAVVLRCAPIAAAEAAALGAHREAAAHYESALRYADSADVAQRAALLDAWSYEVHLNGRIADAVRARAEALAAWRQVGDTRRAGDALRWLSRLAWFEGRREDAMTCAVEAIRVLEPLGPSHELAMAYSTRAQLHVLAEERTLAPAWGDRAIEMAEAIGDVEALVHALTNAACLEPGSSRSMQERAGRLAQQHGLHEHALRAFTWLISDAIQEMDYALAAPFLAEAIEYAEARDIDAFAFYLRGWRARMWVEQGRLEDAEQEALDVLRHDPPTVMRLPSLTALGTALVRRGDARAAAVLDEALTLALATEELQRIAPVACARAEAAWLRGDVDAVRTEAMRAWGLAVKADSAWDIARLGAWLRRAGVLHVAPSAPPGPFALEFAGDSRAAADAWRARGCPYECALALVEGDHAAQREALSMLESIGARSAALLLRRRLAERGVRGVPRGPRASTRANFAGLTRRQMDVLALLAEGLSNQEIGARLFLSTRTVDHHVSALLRKLNVASRVAAVGVYRDMQGAPRGVKQSRSS